MFGIDGMEQGEGGTLDALGIPRIGGQGATRIGAAGAEPVAMPEPYAGLHHACVDSSSTRRRNALPSSNASGCVQKPIG